MQFIKKLTASVLLLTFSFIITACTHNVEPTQDKTEVKISTLKGPTGLGMVKLIEDDENNNTDNNYTFSLASSPDEISAAVLKSEPDIAAVPVNLAAVLYQKTQGQYVVCGINTLGVLYMLDTSGQIQTVEDLRGKTIYATGQGATPEYILRYILSKNGIDPDKDVTIEFKSEHAELATLMSTGQIQIALLPEPNVTTTLANTQNARIALDMTKEWDSITDDNSTLIQGCIIAKKDFLNEHKAAYQTFLQEYQKSVDYVNTDISSASAAIEKHGIVPKASIAEKAIPNCNITLLIGDEMQTKLKPFIDILYQYNHKSVGGTLPDANFYYLEK